MLIRICNSAIRRSLVAGGAKWQNMTELAVGGELTVGGTHGSGRGRGSGRGSARIKKIAKFDVLQCPMLAWSLDV